MTDNELIRRIALSLLPGMDRAKAIDVLHRVGSLDELFDQPESQLKAMFPGRNEWVKAQVRYEAMESARRETEFIRRHGVSCHYFSDDDYYHRLDDCPKAPVMVYTLGNCDINRMTTVGIVGTRHATAYGNAFTEELVGELSQRVGNLAVISGLAYGIDISAHRAALRHEIPTVAVVAHGLSTIYPAVHRETASRMVRGNGMMLSDYHHDAPVHRSNFLARNRIVATLSDVLIVVESGARGGALATASIAAGAGRPVYALPGRVTDRYSDGCNRLIADAKARIFTSVDRLMTDVGWDDLGKQVDNDRLPVDLTDDELKVLRHLATNPDDDTERLADVLALPVGTVMSIMIGLELRDLITQLPNSRYRLTKTIDSRLLL